jgi:hypothetical protein
VCRPTLPLPKERERETQVVLGDPLLVWGALAGPFLERRSVGGNRSLQARSPALPLAERSERAAKSIPVHCPSQSDTVACQFLERRAEGGDSEERKLVASSSR